MEDIPDEDVKNIVDDAITDLVDAEIDMKKEANVIVVDKDAEKELHGTPVTTKVDGITSSESIDYASNPILKGNKKDEEEDNVMAKKEVVEKEKVVPAEENQEKEESTETPTENKEEVVEEKVVKDEPTEPTDSEGTTEPTKEATPTQEEESKEGATFDSNSNSRRRI